eukprot:2161488-Pleurochrysis_carterae.AAC.1
MSVCHSAAPPHRMPRGRRVQKEHATCRARTRSAWRRRPYPPPDHARRAPRPTRRFCGRVAARRQVGVRRSATPAS